MKIHNTDAEAQYPWPEGTYVQGGGVRYGAPFVEAFPTGTYIRGEGATLEEAETKAWEQHLREQECQHEWESRGYKNGAGFCKKCNKFESGVFTYEEVGAFCSECGKPSYWHVTSNGDILCENCGPSVEELYPWFFEDDEPFDFTEADLLESLESLTEQLDRMERKEYNE